MEETIGAVAAPGRLAEQVPQGARLADVGTDHAYLPAWLLLAGRISGAVATDVREGPLQRGRETARLYKVEDRIVFRCCDGLAAVEPQEADTVVIAGMGGELMARIVERAPWTRGCTPSAPAHERPGGAPPVAGDPWVLHSAGDPGPGGREVLRDSHGHRGESPRIPWQSSGRAVRDGERRPRTGWPIWRSRSADGNGHWQEWPRAKPRRKGRWKQSGSGWKSCGR